MNIATFRNICKKISGVMSPLSNKHIACNLAPVLS